MSQMQEVTTTYTNLCEHVAETARLVTIRALLEWDERTIMPTAAGPYRAEQITVLSRIIHGRRTDARIGEWLQQLSATDLMTRPHSAEATTVRCLQRDFDRQTRIPPTLVEEISRQSILGQQAWVAARKNDDFQTFQPLLEQIVDLKRQEAAAVGYTDCAYDALVDEYEPDATTAQLTSVFAALREELVPLLKAIRSSDRVPTTDCLYGEFPIDAQEKFGKHAATQIGFDFSRGRLDVTHHPFCTTLGPCDSRITTRYDSQFFSTAFFGILHEAGHGIYEQGLPSEQFGLPPGMYCSLGIHESQSRLWENLVGRSHAFWEYFYPQAQEAFGNALGGVALDEFVSAVNTVRSSLIRVEADEATYNLHIIIRFELEQALINGSLAVADLPAAWNEKYREYLGVESPNHADGVLQDIHWSSAAIGYFPTYALGNLYAAQFFQAAEGALGDLQPLLATGDFRPLREWLGEKIYQHGQCYAAMELATEVSGKPLSHAPLMAHLRGKLQPLYGLD